MSSSHILIVPVIAAIILVGGLLALALWVTIRHVRLIDAQRHAVSDPVTRLRSHAQRTDDAVCALIGDLERIPATTALLPDTSVRAIYDSHDDYVRILDDYRRELK